MPAANQVMDEIRAMARTTIDELLADARRRLRRLAPAEALQAMRAGAVLIDIRAPILRLPGTGSSRERW